MQVFKDLGFIRSSGLITTQDSEKVFGYTVEELINSIAPKKFFEDCDGEIELPTIQLVDNGCIINMPLASNSTNTKGVYSAVDTNVTYDNGAVLTGGSYITLPTLNLYQMTEYTYSIFVKFNDLTGRSQIISQDDENWNMLYKDGTTLVCRSGGYAEIQNIITSTDKFYHIVVTQDSTTIKVYVDSILVKTFSKGPYIGSGVVIGQDGYLNSGALNGTIKDVKFYNRILTEEEITLLYTKVKDFVVEQEDHQPNWVRYQVEGTDLNCNIFVNNLEQTPIHVDGNKTIFAINETDTNVMNISVNGDYGSLTIKNWTNS